MDILTMRTGFEVELLAPPGSDRQVLADEIAARLHGHVRRAFHADSEPSTVPGVGVFRHLSPAFDVVDADGRPVARLVDDITIAADLAAVPSRPGHRGWYRLLSDDARLLRLVERHTDPAAPLATVLEPVAALLGVEVDVVGSAARVDDAAGATVAVALPLPRGRERPCEIVTPPLVAGHREALERLLAPARDLGFTVPHEAAVHVHVDGEPFRSPHAFANVVRLFGHWREVLWAVLGTNPACVRLAPLPTALLDLVEQDSADWAGLRDAARATGLTKYADVNLTQLVSARPLRDTLEVRILPGATDGDTVVRSAALVEALLRRCLDPRPLPRPDGDAAHDPHGALQDLLGVGHR
ncbi:hypothetical protein Cch01nite_06190 [Cellulomonas chitinilytica]|uniref:Amidoligase enzyme n=1 Tax=Cellulomonas chitinilytica TaxID=398759 RepID=A0A919TXV7_9CELL|nr:amidoligase family protein [Cellulomonas chitinilytica]GIG19895.1 hypothetical protein Cch01nite_06190 [Cellulomonas chitinilytica]